MAVNRKGVCCGFNTTLGGQFESLDIATAVLVSLTTYFHDEQFRLLHTIYNTSTSYFYSAQNATSSSAPIFAWMEERYSTYSANSAPDSLYPDVPPIRKGLLA